MGQSRFGCTGQRDRGTCANTLTIRGDDIESAILDGLKSRLMEPDLFETFAREFTSELNRQRSEASSGRRELDNRIASVTKRIDQLVEAICDGADALALNAKLKELEAEKAKLTHELVAAGDEQPLVHPSLAVIYRKHVATLDDLLCEPTTRQEAFHLIRSLIKEVRLTPEDDELAIELRGDLAGILAISEVGASTPPDQRALQIKMVAGAGFDR